MKRIFLITLISVLSVAVSHMSHTVYLSLKIRYIKLYIRGRTPGLGKEPNNSGSPTPRPPNNLPTE